MSGQNETGIQTFTSGAALARFRRVKLSSGTVVYAGLNEASIGFTTHDCASGDEVGVKLNNYPGTRKVTVASSCTSGAALYSAASGKVDDASSGAGNIIGYALEAASGDGSIIEMVPTGAVTA